MRLFENIAPVKRIRYFRNEFNNGKTLSYILQHLKDAEVKMDTVNGLSKYLKNIKFHKTQDTFFYELNTDIWRYERKVIVDNITVDYELILKKSLRDIIWDEELRSVVSVVCANIRKANKDNEFIQKSFCGILERPANGFKDALQRILFVNQLLWQTKHTLVGLGRLDKILIDYYQNDLMGGVINSNEAKKMLIEFCESLHKYYDFKSNSLKGDTGQIIILGGKEKEAGYLSNELTYMFIEVMIELHLPDPKILLRVANDMPDDLWDIAITCISTGIGCPLFSNDELVIPALQELGYKEEDSFNYGTSACWEPIVIGNSFDQNNAGNFLLTDIINQLINRNTYNTFEDLLNALRTEIINEFLRINKKMLEIDYSDDPIQALFINDCIKNKSYSLKKDARYKFYSILSTGFSNGIDSLMVIKKIVFEEKEMTLQQLYEKMQLGYDEQVKTLIKPMPKFGSDNREVIDMTNTVISFMQNANQIMNKEYGFSCRFGLSSPEYMKQGVISEASFDGRKKGDAFNVHISSKEAIAYTELFNFASSLEYRKGCVNGNVVDVVVSPNLINQNKEKFTQLIKIGMLNGIYQMQLNVISYRQLMEAKINPEKYPNLIVRVWGFSAFFNDLPEEYKDYLINRAKISEGVVD